MEKRPGTYALVLQNESSDEIQVGRWGRLQMCPGYYIYIGSAFGSGGVAARVGRHLRRDKSKRWHIDYMRACAAPVAVWYSYAPERLEHEWAQALTARADFDPIPGFGCSDCSCPTHLLYAVTKPDLAALGGVFAGAVSAWDGAQSAGARPQSDKEPA